MLRRITADLDTNNKIKLHWYIAKALFLKPQRLEIKPSNSKGYHLIMWKDFIETVDNDYIFAIRKFLGDDKKRIEIDRARKNPKQVLFYKKQ